MARMVTEDELVLRAQLFARDRALLCLAVAQFKRRLGGEVSDRELAADKKIANKAATAFCNLLGNVDGFEWSQWNETWEDMKGEAADDDELRQQAATLIWDQWLLNVAAECEQEAQYYRELFRSKRVQRIARFIEVCGKNLLRIQRKLENDLPRPRTSH